ncbi:pirin family protein [Thioalkalivibrio sp. XN8]|uniref:pirin family protein n=1 Tax=Thioalkalivibrio sp. XN8 TaxID=2712863 RepID=UPI0013ED7ABE|nr:pirin family protein [Thioalkalivibrio sp. XN8]NGP52859.1 pirin family protein [Thioalkalivibrio sp. XN8]
MTARRIRQVLTGQPASDGAGVRILRTVGRGQHDMDPFLMLDEIRSDQRDDFVAGFPPHPHRGIETLTVMLDGGFEHQDHMGHRAAIRSGGAQWMSAGRGVIHSEMPLPEESRIHGFQLWINLPAATKLQEPDYAQAEAAELPVQELEAGRLRVLAGRHGELVSPIDHPACEAVVLDLQLAPGGRYQWAPPAGHRALVRPYAGAVSIGAGIDQLDGLESGRMAVLHDAGPITLQAGEEPAGMLLLSGRPLGEPIVQYGPFVMNTPEEIRQAILDYQTGALVAPRH